jgi:hypothetical protein
MADDNREPPRHTLDCLTEEQLADLAVLKDCLAWTPLHCGRRGRVPLGVILGWGQNRLKLAFDDISKIAHICRNKRAAIKPISQRLIYGPAFTHEHGQEMQIRMAEALGWEIIDSKGRYRKASTGDKRHLFCLPLAGFMQIAWYLRAFDEETKDSFFGCRDMKCRPCRRKAGSAFSFRTKDQPKKPVEDPAPNVVPFRTSYPSNPDGWSGEFDDYPLKKVD